MSRINTVTAATANAEQHALFEAIHNKLGSVPIRANLRHILLI